MKHTQLTEIVIDGVVVAAIQYDLRDGAVTRHANMLAVDSTDRIHAIGVARRRRHRNGVTRRATRQEGAEFELAVGAGRDRLADGGTQVISSGKRDRRATDSSIARSE